MTGSPMFQDIARTPAVLDGLLKRADELAAFARVHLTPGAGGRLHVFGCGDGLLAAEAATGPILVAHTALDMLAFTAARLQPADRVLAISMSGNVDRGVEAMRAVLARGIPAALLTNGAGGQLGALSTPCLSLDVPSVAPFLCGTATYSATLLALLLLTGAVGPEAVRRLSAALPQAIEAARRGLADLSGNPLGVRFLGVGRTVASAGMGTAKLVEVTRLPTWSADIEEFAHSQFWSAQPGELIVYLAADPLVAELATHSARLLHDMGFGVLALETADAPVPTAPLRLRAPAVPEALSPLAFAPLLQVLAWQLSRAGGLDPDTRAHLREDTVRFTTSRGLTRRALIGTGA